MKLFGLDFDNTLVRYDELFHKLALEKGLIDSSLQANKKTIRDHLREKGQDEEFTLLQGEVYGLRILEAKPADGMLDTLKFLSNHGINMCIISHKTTRPYKGPAYDLHTAAWGWLEKHGFFSSSGPKMSPEQVFFEESKTKKISKIRDLKCTHYIDDLPEILELIELSCGTECSKILYDPHLVNQKIPNVTAISKWHEAINIIT